MAAKRTSGNYRMKYRFVRKSKYANVGRNVSVKRTTFFQSIDNDTR